MTTDSPEQIAMCLRCEKLECNNCARVPESDQERGKSRARAVVAFGNGEERLFTSMSGAAREMHVSPQSIQQAIRKGLRSAGYYWRYADE